MEKPRNINEILVSIEAKIEARKQEQAAAGRSDDYDSGLSEIQTRQAQSVAAANIVPNGMLRSALFGAIRKGRRRANAKKSPISTKAATPN